jgi:hypothetical protein
MKTKIYQIGLMVFSVIGLLLTTNVTSAAINKQITYQGKLTRPSDGQPVTDGNYDLVVRIYDADSGGNCLWSVQGDCLTPTAKSVTTSGGIFTTNLGESGDNVLNLDFSTDSYYLGIKVGADDEMTPRRRITATPQSFNSNNVIGDGYVNLTSVPTGTGICQGMLCLNPSSANATDTLLGVQSGANPIFKVENDGKVGIGTNTPNKSLHIKTATGTNAEIDIQSGSNNLWAMYQDDTAGSLRFWNDTITGEKNALAISNNGAVGIGTVLPTAGLHLQRSTADASMLIESTGGASYDQNIHFKDTASDWYIGNRWSGATNSFGIGRTNSKDDMIIDSSGNVGIGAVNPGAQLQVGTIGGGAGTAERVRIAGKQFGYWRMESTDTTTLAGFGIGYSALTPALFIQSDGANAGIINIAGGITNLSNGTSNMILYGPVGYGIPTFTTRSAGTKIVLSPYISGSTTDFALGVESSALWSSVPTSGNSFKWYAGTTNVMLLDGSGNLTANSFIYSSDQRLKKNIQPLTDNTLEKIKQIQPVSFNWKESGKPEIGFIAQNVEQVYPDLVTTDPNTGMKGLKYGNMTAVLMEAIQEQQQQIDELKQEVETLKNK